MTSREILAYLLIAGMMIVALGAFAVARRQKRSHRKERFHRIDLLARGREAATEPADLGK